MADIKLVLEDLYSLKERKCYSQMICTILELYKEDTITRQTVSAIVRKSELMPRAAKEQLIDLVLDYCEMVLDDDILTQEEIDNVTYLKLLLSIVEGDFREYGKMERVNALLIKQLERIYEDDTVNDEESLSKVELQSLFDLNYDEFTEIVNEVARQSLDRGAKLSELDTIIKN